MTTPIPKVSSASGNKPVAMPEKLPDAEPETVGTPEGDNEYGPDTPLTPAPEGLQTPPGNAPQPFDADHTEESKPSGIVKFIDEVARGEYM